MTTGTTPEPDPTSAPLRPAGQRVAGQDPLRAEIESLRPHDHVEADRLETAIAERLFGIAATPPRIDRFIILGRLGTGGMGVVYDAYDPGLERHVALKILRDSSRVGRVEHERLLREAHALARITHPNVVTVHEVGQLDTRVFVVMEFVVGQTLDSWARTGRHGWREVLAVYRQAGRGLEAAHAAGLVHRDFKPQNAIIGQDGRVRVVDFGLARGESPIPNEDDDVTSSAELPGVITTWRSSLASTVDRFDALLTHPNSLLGTPAYMSPEQCARQPVGPASDQYSFCVALYEALVGTRPFDGETPLELAERILTGHVCELPRGTRVPAWLLATVRRGMSVDVDERFGSMTELLAALDRDPARARRRWLSGAAFTALAGISVVTLLQSSATLDPCPGSAAALAEVWDPERRAEILAHLSGLPTPDAPVVSARVVDTVDDYAERWQQVHRDACLAHDRGEHSGTLLDKRMACLARRRAALDGAVDVLGTADVMGFENAAVMVHDLPPLYACSDLELLAAELPLPDDPAAARGVTTAREGLARATMLVNLGRLEDAREQVAHWELQAHALRYEPLVAEALLVRGRSEMEHDPGDASRPSATLLEAFHRGLASGNDEVAAEALVRRLYVEAIRLGSPALREQEDYGLIRALIDRLRESSRVEGMFLNNMGNVAMAHGDFEAARTSFQRALEVRENAPEPNPMEVLETRFNLALVEADEGDQLAALETVSEGFERELGANHWRTFTTRAVLARSIKDPLTAQQRFADLCQVYERSHPEHVLAIATCLLDQAVRLLDIHQLEQAAQTFERVATLLEAPQMPLSQRLWHSLARGQALSCRARHAEAVAELQATASELEATVHPRWMETDLAKLHGALGQALVADGRPVEAMAPLDAAIPILTRAAAQRVDQTLARTLAQARLTRAHANIDAYALGLLVPAHPSFLVQPTVALLDAAESWYRTAGAGHTRQIAEIMALRARVPVR